MSIKELVIQNRSCRSFDESRPITKEVMTELVDLARKTASGMNRQPLRYRILCEREEVAKMTAGCRFATLLGIPLPPAGQAPTGYIVIFTDAEAGSPTSLALKDVGIAAQTILLAATEQGFGGCMLGSFDPKALCQALGIEERYQPQLAIALGTPAEKFCLVEAEDGSLAYFRDESNVHHVPKRPLDEVLI